MIPLILGAIFAVWSLIDIASYALTGEEAVYNLAVALGWTGSMKAGSTNIIVEWGMSGMEFLMTYWVFICAFLAVFFLTIWASTRPIKHKGAKH